MYLEKLKLHNYRRFKKAEIDFSKITLLLGPNSSGKTAIVSGLLSLAQTERFPIYINPNGPLVETGDFGEISHAHSKKNEVALSVQYRDDDEKGSLLIDVTGRFVFDSKTKMPVLTSARVDGGAMSLSVSKFRTKYRLNWEYQDELDSAKKLGKELPEFMSLLERLHRETSGATTQKKSVRKAALTQNSASKGFVDGSLDEMSRGLMLSTPWATLALTSSLSTSAKFRKKFSYLGSHRSAPQRTYFNTVGGDLRVGPQGQNAVEQVIDWGIRGDKKLANLVKIMKKIGLASQMKPHQLSGGRVELRVKTSTRGASASIMDVGFGVNQFLPIAVAELQLPAGSTIAISQPETHLHPSAQAEVAEHFVRNVKQKKFRYIVESHSEYMVNRLRRLIVKGELASKDVAAYYVSPRGDGTSELVRMSFKDDGVIAGAPSEFFETYQVDVLGIAMRE